MNPIYNTYFSRNLSTNELNYFGKNSVKLVSNKPEWLNISAWETNYDSKYGYKVDSPVTQLAYLVGFITSNCPVPRGSQIVIKQIKRIEENKVILQKWIYTGGLQACPENPTYTETKEFNWDEAKAKHLLCDW